MTATIEARSTLLLDGEGENGVQVPLIEPWRLDTIAGQLSLDDLIDLTTPEMLELGETMTERQKLAVIAVFRDSAVQQYVKMRHYRDDPIGFVTDILHEHAYSLQREILEAIRDYERVSIPSCHSAGKSHCAAMAMAWWVSCHAPGDAFVVSTAPSMAQVRSVLWRYVNRMHGRGHLPGRTNMTQWYIAGELVAIGRKPADTNPAALQGLHAAHLLVVIDEADGVHVNIYDALNTLVTSANGRILAIGNPDTNVGRFYDANLPGSTWKSIRISAYDTPNFNGHPKRTRPDEIDVPKVILDNLVSVAWVQSVIDDHHYGPDSAYYRSKVEAIAPEDAPMAVMPLSKLRECMPYREPADRLMQWDPDTLELLVGDDLGPVEVGLDVGAGGDLTVARERRGPVLGRALRLKDADTMRQVPKIVQFLRLTGAHAVKVDVIGIGKGLADRLRELKAEGAHDARVVYVNVGRAGRKPNNRRSGFPRLRDQLWWEVGRENTFGQAWDLSTLWDEEWIIPELFQPTYEERSNGLIAVQSKDEMRAALGHSPDDADSILLAYAKLQTPSKATTFADEHF